jgi:hypothetical protein
MIHSNKGAKCARILSTRTPVSDEEECYDRKIKAVFFDDGAAHHHIVRGDGDEEEVYKDEAIRLLLAANGFD